MSRKPRGVLIVKYWDIKPVCPQWRNHRHYRRVFAAFPTSIHGRVATLKVPHAHICKARMIIEAIPDNRALQPGASVKQNSY